eukprot:1144517-Pelagomonas_calceolata.AAC.3
MSESSVFKHLSLIYKFPQECNWARQIKGGPFHSAYHAGLVANYDAAEPVPVQGTDRRSHSIRQRLVAQSGCCATTVRPKLHQIK